MTNHAERLRHMAAGWLQTAEGTEKYGLAREKEADIAHYRAQVAALLAGAEALERLGAIESTGSTILPKSASASEEACECAFCECALPCYRSRLRKVKRDND